LFSKMLLPTLSRVSLAFPKNPVLVCLTDSPALPMPSPAAAAPRPMESAVRCPKPSTLAHPDLRASLTVEVVEATRAPAPPGAGGVCGFGAWL